MAYSISICDTHRLPYFNATLTAYKIGTTTHVKFKHGNDGTPQYTELQTNARGFICDTNGNILSRGIFVEEDALVKVTFRDGVTTEYEVCKDDDVSVNDGKLLGKKNKDSSDDDVEEKWSANSPQNYTLDYDHLIHKPAINEWAEVEQIVTMDSDKDQVDVDKFAKSMTVQFDQVCCPDGWEWDGSNWKLKSGMSDKPNGEWSLTLKASPDRVAQVLCIRNWTPWRLAIKNVSNQVIAVIDPYSGNADKGEIVTLYGKTEPTLPYQGSVDTQLVGTIHPIRFNATSAENTSATPLVINDYTPDVAMVEFLNEYNYTPDALYVKSEVTKTRKVRILLNNVKGNSGLPINDMTSGSLATIGVLANQSIVEFFVAPYGITPFSTSLKTAGAVASLHMGIDSPKLAPETLVANILIDGITGNLYLDDLTAKTITLNFTNSNGMLVQQNLSCGGVLTPLYVPNGTSTFVIEKSGTAVNVIKSPASDGEIVPTSGYSQDGDRDNIFVYPQFQNGAVLRVNFSAFNDKFGTSFGDNGGDRSSALLSIPAFNGSVLSFVLHFEACMLGDNNSSRHVALMFASGTDTDLTKNGGFSFRAGSTDKPYVMFPERRVAVTIRKVGGTYSIDSEEILL